LNLDSNCKINYLSGTGSVKTMNPADILQARNLGKGFQMPDASRLELFFGLEISLKPATITAVTGASGAGKSTLLHLLGTLDTPDEGEIIFCGQNILAFDDKRRAVYRNREIGFLFQFHYLIPELTVLENVAAPSLAFQYDRRSALDRAADLLAEIGLADKGRCFPWQLSGGERQRAAIARALINAPRLFFADEPTGSLDWRNGLMIMELLQCMIAERGLAALIVTHNQQLASMAERVFLLEKGSLVKLNE